MKAALNGVPGFSVLDGWWREGCVEGVTGWAIGGDASSADGARDADDLYRKLQHVVAPLFYDDRDAWIRIMRQCIALNASFSIPIAWCASTFFMRTRQGRAIRAIGPDELNRGPKNGCLRVRRSS